MSWWSQLPISQKSAWLGCNRVRHSNQRVLRQAQHSNLTFAARSCVNREEGVYVVGTGGTGATEAFLTLGAAHFAIILASAFLYRVPQAGWAPAGWVAASSPTSGRVGSSLPPAGTMLGAPQASSSDMVTNNNVHIDEALRTPQFYLLWTCLFANVSAGIGILSVAKTMMGDIFGTTMPQLVDSAFAAMYVSMISMANMGGRLAWASASDYLGRKATFAIFFGCGLPLYASLPSIAALASSSDNIAPLVMFTSSTMVMFTMYGGGFATVPAYLADLFGTKYIGGIHGRLLTAWSAAGVLGPVGLAVLRKNATHRAIGEEETLFASRERHASARLVHIRLRDQRPPPEVDTSCHASCTHVPGR